MVNAVHNLGNFPGSDHTMLSWNITYCSKAHEDSERIAYNYAKGDYISIKTEMATIEWVNLMQHLTVEDSWNEFKEILNTLKEKYIPKKEYMGAPKQKP